METTANTKRVRPNPQPEGEAEAPFPYENAVWFSNLLDVLNDEEIEVQTELHCMWANDSMLKQVK